MGLFFSPSLTAFFDDAISADIPADAVAITPARHRKLFDGVADGGQIEADAHGQPRLVRRKKATVAQRRLAACRQIKRIAARRIEAVSPIWRQLNDQRSASIEGAARFARIDAIRSASDAIEAAVQVLPGDALDALDIANHPLWPGDSE